MVDIEKSFEKESSLVLNIGEIAKNLSNLGFDVTQDELESMVDPDSDIHTMSCWVIYTR